MIIIIVGPDGAGKTTLANQLSQQTGYPIKHRDKPKTEEDKKRMYEEYMNEALTGKNMIYDRYCYCEMVYGTVMRDASVISDAQMLNIESALCRHGAIIIHCTDDLVTLWDRCTQRGEDYITSIETLAQIKDAYEEIMHGMIHAIPVVKYKING